MFASLWRAMPRLIVLWVLCLTLWIGSHHVAPPFPPELAPILFGAALSGFGILVGDVSLRILQPKVDPQQAWMQATRSMSPSMSAAVAYAGRMLFAAVVMLLFATASRAAEPPAAALQYLPILKSEQLAQWPSMPLPPALGAQVEQETCITLKHRSCWNPRAELRTSREQGVGFGQFTRSWTAAGALRFDALAEVKAAHREALAGLSWANPYDPVLQLRAMVLKDRDTWSRMAFAPDAVERLAFTFAAYNGGIGGVLSDRRMCGATEGCDETRWFGHVEHTSLKAMTAVAGYGKSFFEINREYPRNILRVRLARYSQLA